MSPMLSKLPMLGPEIALLVGAVLCLLFGLWPTPGMRRLTPWVAGLALLAAAFATLLAAPALSLGEVRQDLTRAAQAPPGELRAWYAWAGGYLSAATHGPMGFVNFIRLAACGIGVLLLLTAVGVPESRRPTADLHAGRKPFDATRVFSGEFYAFFLFSLAGLMLVAGANDLVWLFLALELTSLPTYVMVAVSRDRAQGQEAAVKYFFLGALAAATFLYGFTLLYGAAGTTQLFPDPAHPQAVSLYDYIRGLTSAGQPLPWLWLGGLVLSLVGLAFKVAAVPMHFYAADVYQGAASPVTAFLAFVPKAAGFAAIILLLSVGGWPLPPAVLWLLWLMAVATMTVGNVLGLLQTSVKRVLAYSSIAHSGYMIVGLLAARSALDAPGTPSPGPGAMGDGVAAVLFYLVVYGLATLAAFAVLASLQARGEEADSFSDLAGLGRRHPLPAAILLLAVLSLIGLPPLAGFLGKVYLFGSALSHATEDQQKLLWLVVIAVLNSAVSAVYYLRIVAACYFGQPSTPQAQADPSAAPDEAGPAQPVRAPARMLAGGLAALAAVLLGLVGGPLVDSARQASESRPSQLYGRRETGSGVDSSPAPSPAPQARSAKSPPDPVSSLRSY